MNNFFVVALFALLGICHGSPINDPFIVGGDPATIQEFPHSLALLDMLRGGASGYWCGASNIHPRWALSAAHCLEANTPSTFIHLYGGSTSRLSGGHLFFTSRYVLHPLYSSTTLDNDIAVIELAPGYYLEGFPYVTSIPLPPLCTATCCGVCPAGSDVQIAGWGRIENGSLPEFLLQVSMGVMTNEDCQTVYFRIITSRMFCSVVENGRSICNGDSGSAVVRDGVQVGIVSFGSAVCGDGSRPAGHVRVEDSNIRGFINELTGL